MFSTFILSIHQVLTEISFGGRFNYKLSFLTVFVTTQITAFQRIDPHYFSHQTSVRSTVPYFLLNVCRSTMIPSVSFSVFITCVHCRFVTCVDLFKEPAFIFY